MWSPHQQPEPIEKIRKQQWTVENTRETQRVVNRLVRVRHALALLGGQTVAVDYLNKAIARFASLDRAVKPHDTEAQG